MGHSVAPETATKIGVANHLMWLEKQNKIIIETPWGPLGLRDAAEKAGLTWRLFYGRYVKGIRGDDLFNKERNLHRGGSKEGHLVKDQTKTLIGQRAKERFLAKVNHIIIDTPWGPMPQYDASLKLGVKWSAFNWRVAKKLPMEELFNLDNYRESAKLKRT
jgi:hypothetical protein